MFLHGLCCRPTGVLNITISTSDKLIIFDGVCGLCHAWVRYVIRHDNKGDFKFTSMQSEKGQAMLKQLNMSVSRRETMLYVENDIAYEKSVAFLKIVRHLRFPVNLLSCLTVFPRCLRDYIYDRFAQNRYRLFGVRDECLLTQGDAKDRFL